MLDGCANAAGSAAVPATVIAVAIVARKIVVVIEYVSMVKPAGICHI